MKPEKISTTKYIGRCIYCGSSSNLTNEHIVPKGLQGPWILLKASCQECNKITTRFERRVLREQLLAPRVGLGLHTYHKKERPNSVLFQIERDGRSETISLQGKKCPPIFMMLTLKKPRYIESYEYEKGVQVTGLTLHGPDSKLIRKALGSNRFEIRADIAGDCFERMLAKIGYGMTILTYGPDILGKCYVLPCILGQKDDVGYWVGEGRDYQALPVEKSLHRVNLIKDGNEIRALIRLFANYSTPEYLVIVGKLREESSKNTNLS